jgi:rhodanese-related sulfurtransferase
VNKPNELFKEKLNKIKLLRWICCGPVFAWKIGMDEDTLSSEVKSMNRIYKVVLPLVAGLIALTCLLATGAENPRPDRVAKQCLRCHADYSQEQGIIAGSFSKRSQKARTIQVKIGSETHLVKYDEATALNLAADLSPKVPIKVRLRRDLKDTEDLWAAEIWTMPPIEIPKKQLATTEAIKALVAGEKETPYLLVDSRPKLRFQEGHIPTAVSIPFTSMHTMRSKLPEDKGRLLIFYCGGNHCTLSPMASQMAEQWGYSNVKVYHDGAPGWKKNGNILLSTDAYLKKRKGNYVLIDTRGKEKASQGFIPGSVAITPEQLSDRKNQFPLDRKAPIILYSEHSDLKRLKPAVQTILSWGYKKVFVLEQGFQGWVAAGREVKKGVPDTEIVYNPKPLPGEISTGEFARIVEDDPEDTVILDVRSPNEAAAGALPSAVNIPLDELQMRLNELPRGKEIVAHCKTGMRAEMAYKILKKAGYEARFLNDNIDIVGKQVYLGTTLELAEKSTDLEALAETDIEVSTPDSNLCARMIRHGQTAFERRRYREAKKLFWKAILADPTSKLAWRSYDMAVVFALAERAENDPSCIGAPDVPVTEPGGQATGLFSKEDEGC